MNKIYHISICICTYKRPDRLNKLLLNIEKQYTENLFNYSIIVIDNDNNETARETVNICKQNLSVPVKYFVEPEQNIARARNKAIENAEGDFIALIDDDEFPNEKWLYNHYQTLTYYQSDGTLGPVFPVFDVEPPSWVIRGHFFDRPTHPTGHVLKWEETRTGNALLKRNLFLKESTWFNPSFGSGGEDRDFFKRKIIEGNVFVWCNEAHVFESVPAKRWEMKILIKRALLRGKMALNNSKSKPISVFKSTIAVAIYTCCLPIFYLIGYHMFVKYLIKNCDHLGKILAALGVDLVTDKYIIT